MPRYVKKSLNESLSLLKICHIKTTRAITITEVGYKNENYPLFKK